MKTGLNILMLILISFSLGSFRMVGEEPSIDDAPKVTKKKVKANELIKTFDELQDKHVKKMKILLTEWHKDLQQRVEKQTGTKKEADSLSLIEQLTEQLVKPEMTQETMKQLNSNISAINKELDSYKELLKKISDWESNLDLSSGSGSVGSHLTKAEAFSRERQFRRELQDSLKGIPEKLDRVIALIRMQAIQELTRLKQAQALMDLMSVFIDKEKVKPIEIETTISPSEAEMAMGLSGLRRSGKKPPKNVLGEYEIYEVKKSAGFREIAALPEVYGDPENWKILHKANIEKYEDPLAKIPAGELLIVPNLNQVDNP